MRKYTSIRSHILGFHGCDKETGTKVLNGIEKLKPSQNKWDWLGNGIYFWEHNPMRAFQYAKDVAEGRQKARVNIKTPFVIGCIIDLGRCLNLTEPSQYTHLIESYKILKNTYEQTGKAMPENRGDARILYCAVFMYMHISLKLKGHPPYDTIRGAFPEGNEIYEGCAIKDQTHIQICVRNTESILGYFLPLPIKKINPYL